MESAYAIASGGISLITMADEEITTCATIAMATANQPCGGGSEKYAAVFGLVNGMEPKSDYSASFDNTAYYQPSPNPGSCRSDLANAVKYTFPGYCKYTTSDPSTVMAYLSHYGPATIVVDASNWNVAVGRTIISDPTSCSPLTENADHAINLVGWGTDNTSGKDYWIVRNQWSSSWGMSGFAWILKDSQNVCGVTNSPFWIAPCSSTIGLTAAPTVADLTTSAPTTVKPTSTPTTVKPTSTPTAVKPTSAHITGRPATTPATTTYSPTTIKPSSPPTAPPTTGIHAPVYFNFLAPELGSSYEIGFILSIRWNVSGLIPTACNVNLFDQGSFYFFIGVVNSEDLVYLWTIPNSILVGTAHQIQLICGNLSITSPMFKIIAAPSAQFILSITAPALGHVCFRGENCTLQWTYSKYVRGLFFPIMQSG